MIYFCFCAWVAITLTLLAAAAWGNAKNPKKEDIWDLMDVVCSVGWPIVLWGYLWWRLGGRSYGGKYNP